MLLWSRTRGRNVVGSSPGAAEDPPCRGEPMHVKSVETQYRPPVDLSGYGDEFVAGVSWARVLLPLKTSRAEEAIAPADVVVRKEGCQLRCPPRHSTEVQNYEEAALVRFEDVWRIG
ncbi:hypothetical protein TNCV_3106071 [Trichonephila clavipes]|nr:hypothetical protein TNCV_3106071 [Trichonephila clavipes]